MTASEFGAAGQKQWIDLMEKYIAEACEHIESNPIPDFPKVDELYVSGGLDQQKADKHLAEYEFLHVQMSNKLSQCQVKKIQSKMFLAKAIRALGDMALRDWKRDVNTHIARIQDVEVSYREVQQSLDKAMTAVRSIKSNVPKLPGLSR